MNHNMVQWSSKRVVFTAYSCMRAASPTPLVKKSNTSPPKNAFHASFRVGTMETRLNYTHTRPNPNVQTCKLRPNYFGRPLYLPGEMYIDRVSPLITPFSFLPGFCRLLTGSLSTSPCSSAGIASEGTFSSLPLAAIAIFVTGRGYTLLSKVSFSYELQ